MEKEQALYYEERNLSKAGTTPFLVVVLKDLLMLARHATEQPVVRLFLIQI